ncbi:MAG: hypothetical protein KAH08_02170 [Methylococcales bacterium]|nr:hypothetical protein [Methylococcales bacterium]
MKIQHLTGGLVAALVLASPVVGAEDYPAANFEPTVIYSDVEEASVTSSSTTTTAKKSKPDSQYPATNFEPTVLYHDADYKHQATDTASSTITKNSEPSRSASASSASVSSQSEEVLEVATEASDDAGDASIVTLLGLLVLAIAGFVLLKGKSASAPEKPSKKTRVASTKRIARATLNSATGVGRYLSKNMPELSSVAKYLQNKEKTPTSGVAKYVAKRVVAAKAAAVSKKTGVEKYLRDKG